MPANRSTTTKPKTSCFIPTTPRVGGQQRLDQSNRGRLIDASQAQQRPEPADQRHSEARQHWRPGVEPCFAGLLDNPQFVAMMDNLSSRMDLMREQIAFDAAFDSGWRLQT